MSSKIKFTIDDLYKTLKRHDVDILKHFNDEKLSDYDYLFYAINSDIMSNALNIVINLMIDNEASVGVDNNARAIIEGFVILKMLGSGAIDSEQQKIFRSHFAIVDYENFKKLIREAKDHPAIVEAKKRYDDAISFLTTHFKCSKKALFEHFVDVDDPLFYIKKTLKEDIGFVTLLNKYPIFEEHTYRIYEFFSIMIHPRYVGSESLERSIQKMRQSYTYMVLDYVVKYLKAEKLIVIDDSAKTFDDDFTNNPLLKNNVNNIFQTILAFDLLTKNLCILKDGVDGFSIFFLTQIRHLLIDMELCESLGYNEQVISKYKSFIEMAAIHATINCVDDIDEFKTLKLAYSFSSKLQLCEHLKAMNLSNDDFELSGLRELYEQYYRDKFKIATYEEFEKGMKNNSLYFLDPSNQKKSYNKYVREAINEVIPLESLQKQMFDMYKLSKDMNHASGYNFNSSPGITEFYSHTIMKSVFDWIINFIVNASAVVDEMDHKTNLEPVLEMFRTMAEFENEAMKKIGKKYEEDYNKYSNQ